MKTRRISFATAAFALTLSASSAFAGTSRGFENGGKFVNFDPVIEAYNRSGAPFRIVGQCNSACTLFLSIKNVCIERNAIFGFHAGNDGKGNVSFGATRHMQNAYNAKLRQFVIENRYMETFEFHTISGVDMIEKFGYPACGPQHRLAEDEVSPKQRGLEGSYTVGQRSVQPSAPAGAEGKFTSRRAR